MCVRNTVAFNEAAAKFVGASCPACHAGESTLDYMRFLDPHGAERVDQEIFECSCHRHTFVVTDGGLRLLAADGKRVRDRKIYCVSVAVS